MNKTININLGGFFFHIDEIAYLKLKRYLESISKSLNDDPQGKNEIIADIEARISELLSEKITDVRQVVNENDIADIIKIMGQPEDYAATEDSFSEANYSYQRNNSSTKKLFRDGEDKFLGGVASGLAHYLDLDTIWVRLGLLALFVFGGFGILLYIILWILLPEAKTTAEKLQMEGTPVNIDNIEKKIREEFNYVSENIKDAASQASVKIKQNASEISEKVNKKFSGKTKKNNGFQDLLDTIGTIFLVLFKIIGKFIGIIIIFISAAVILSLIIGGFSIGSLEWMNVDGMMLQYPPFFYDAILPKWLLTLCAFLVIGIPFLLLFILGLRILSTNLKRLSKPASLSLLAIWILALLVLIFNGLDFGSSHSVYGQKTEKNKINLAENDTIHLKIRNDDAIFYRHHLRRSTRKEEVLVNNQKMVYSNAVKVAVRKSDAAENYLIIRKESKGKNSFTAAKNAENIQYQFQVDEKKLILNAYFLSEYKNLWKDEEIQVIIYLKKNTTIYFDQSVNNFIYDYENENYLYDKDLANHHYKMTNKLLVCTDCELELENESIIKKSS